jgi:hypothetical protein
MQSLIWTPTQGKPRYEQRPRLSPAHPLNQYLVAWWLMNEMAGNNIFDVAGRFAGTITVPSWLNTGLGPAITVTDNTHGVVGCGNILAIDAPSRLTMSAWIYPTNFADYRHIIDKHPSNMLSGWSCQTGGAGVGSSARPLFFAANGSVYRFCYTTSDSLVLNIWQHIVFVYNAAGSTDADKVQIYVNAVLKALTFPSAMVASIAATSSPVNIGDGAVVGDNSWAGQIANVMLFNSNLGINDIKDLYLNPFGTPYNPRLIVQPQRKWFVPRNYYSLACSAGSFSLSGNATGLKADRKLALSAGAFAETGNTATLTAARKLSVDVGAFSETGNAISLKATRTISADAGSCVLTGMDAALKASRKLSMDAGLFALSGIDSVLRAARKLSTDVGSYALSGSDVGLKVGRRMPVAVGAFSLSGIDLNPRTDRKISVDAGAFSLSGQDIAFARALKFFPESGAFAVSGQDAGVKAARKLAVSAGAFSLTGRDVNLVYTPVGAYILQADSATFNLAGEDINLIYFYLSSYVLHAQTAVFALAGHDAALKAARIIALAHEVFILIGLDINMSTGLWSALPASPFTTAPRYTPGRSAIPVLKHTATSLDKKRSVRIQ